MKSLTLRPITKVKGSVSLPGSKSISNRVLLLAAMAKGKTVFRNLLDSDDTRYMLNALKLLGIYYKLSNNRTHCTIIGNDGFLSTKKSIEIFLGNSGTAVRFLTAALCLSNNNIIITGDKRMKERPINHLVSALRQGGAKIDYLEKESFPPLRLQGKFLGGNIMIDGSISSQFITALLISAPLVQKDTTIFLIGNLTSKPYIDTTLSLMKDFGVIIKNQFYQKFVISGNQKYYAPNKKYYIDGDASSASYFLAAAAIKGGTVKVTGINGLNNIQGEIRFSDVLKKMGANVIFNKRSISCTRGHLNSINMDVNHIPDTAMTIAITALFAKGTTVLRNIYNWRIKETNRLFAIATELRKLGAIVKEGEDCICITPPSSFQSTEINTYNDHRIAMCFSLVALAEIPIVIHNYKCINKTFPSFFKKFISIII